MIAHPFEARNPASSRSVSQVTVLAIALLFLPTSAILVLVLGPPGGSSDRLVSFNG